MLLLIVMPFWTFGFALAQVAIYNDEALYLNALSVGGYNVFQEGFEDNIPWNATRTPKTAYSVVNRGTRWTSNHPDAISRPSHISTSSGAARTGGWGIFSSPHGDPDAQGSPDVCDVTDPPSYCFKKDGFMGTREPGAVIFYAVGGWVNGISGGKIILILDGNESAPVDFGGLGIITNTHKFFGVIDTRGFTNFEFRETEGKIGDEKYIFADDFTFAVSSCWDMDVDGYEDEACGGNDCNDIDPNIHPGAAEICDGKDNDCNGIIPTAETTDSDNDGSVACLDCDDIDATRFPGNLEICDDVDNDCDEIVNEENATGCTLYFKDADGDGYGVDGDNRCLCNPDSDNKYTAVIGGDPNDTNPGIPGSTITVEMPLGTGWSMISLPVEPADARISSLFPDAVAVFKFSTKYDLLSANESLIKGVGYWIYIPAAHTYSITGIPISNYTIPELRGGWSMIGSGTYSSRVWLNIGTIRAVFGFSNKYDLIGSGNHVGLLERGKGYWINCSELTIMTVERE